MPLWTHSSKYVYRIDNYGTDPSATPGTSVVPGNSNSEGSWTEILPSIANKLYGFYIRVADGGASAAARGHLLDIGWDPAGGTSYVAQISNIVCGQSALTANFGTGHQFFFPLRVPAGASIAARIQGSNATPGTVRVSILGFGQPKAPWTVPFGQYAETIGTISSSAGVAFTPGTAADGTWVSLGTTVRNLWWFQLAYQIQNSTTTQERTYIDLAVGDSTNKSTIIRLIHSASLAEQINSVVSANLLWHGCYCPVPAGSELWVRGRCEDAPDTGYSAVAIGIGG